MRRSCLFALALAAGACTVTKHPVAPQAATPSEAGTWDDVLSHPVNVTVETHVSARWAVARKGLVNLRHPEAKAAGLRNEKVPIVLPVHVVRHPSRGDFIVDTGIDRSMAEGDPVAVRGAVASFLREVEPVEHLASIVERNDLDLRGVLMTHVHLDHVLGLPDVPRDTPIYVGPGETGARSGLNGLLRPTYRRLLTGRPPLRELDCATSKALPPFACAIDLLGDGSLWAIPSPGHTPGSVAYLANAKTGPVLFVGDTSHTWWGWKHGVEPGTFTEDQARNRQSLAALRTFVEQHPQTRVLVGHEL
jgi:glyoxylase-like metal-dependent hydrolase (beta-lactamase superfamily II)